MAPKNRTPRSQRVSEPATAFTTARVPGRAKLFWNGRSQAVRLPREFRFEGDEVTIRREGERVILEPLNRRQWPTGYFERLHRMAPLFADFTVPEPLPPGGTEVDLDRP